MKGNRPEPTTDSLISRRDVLRQSAVVAGGTTVGLASAGVAAASECTDDSASYQEKDGWEWYTPKDGSADNYDCDYLSPYYKVEHASALVYYGTCFTGSSYIHEFHGSAHSEHFTRDYCSSSWERSHGITGHRAGFDNNFKSGTSMPASREDMVKAHPPEGSSSIPDEYMDYAYTALSLAVGRVYWPAGAAMAIAGTLLDHANKDESDPYDLTYDWDYGGPSYSKPCGTHWISQLIRSDSETEEGVNFEYTDEVWGRYPNYVKTEYSVSYDSGYGCESGATSSDAETTGDTSCESSDSNPGNAPIDVGDVIQDEAGNDIEVTAIDAVTQRMPGTEGRTVHRSELSGTLRDVVDQEEVVYKRIPLEVTRRDIAGEYLEKRR